MRLIWVGREAKYFCKRGLTRFLKIRSDLPVGLICRSRMQKFDLPWRQISTQLHKEPSYPAHAGYPVRRGFSAQSLASLEYRIARLRGR
jgi:hypothetical protein